jgi:hypothetical protein
MYAAENSKVSGFRHSDFSLIDKEAFAVDKMNLETQFYITTDWKIQE